MAAGSCGVVQLSRGQYAEKQGYGLCASGFGGIIVADRSQPGEAGWTKQKLLFVFPQSFQQ
jgi:hypothetical protein